MEGKGHPCKYEEKRSILSYIRGRHWFRIVIAGYRVTTGSGVPIQPQMRAEALLYNWHSIRYAIFNCVPPQEFFSVFV